VSDVRLDGPEPLTQLSDAVLEARATALLEVVVAGLRPGRA
jgi:hypothetical protein